MDVFKGLGTDSLLLIPSVLSSQPLQFRIVQNNAQLWNTLIRWENGFQVLSKFHIPVMLLYEERVVNSPGSGLLSLTSFMGRFSMNAVTPAYGSSGKLPAGATVMISLNHT